MKKLPFLLITGAVLVAGFLAVRVVHLERRLAAAENRQAPEGRPLPAWKPSATLAPDSTLGLPTSLPDPSRPHR